MRQESEKDATEMRQEGYKDAPEMRQEGYRDETERLQVGDRERAEMSRFLDALDRVLGPLESAGPGRASEVSEPARAEDGLASVEPAREWAQAVVAGDGDGSEEPGVGPASLKRRVGEGSRPAALGRKRARRWGRAARKAAQSEIADGDRGPLRSLRAVRESFPMSQQELADRSRLSRATIARIEQGRPPQPRTRRMIARVLGELPTAIRWE